MSTTSAPSNWAGNVTYGAARLHRPASLDELRRITASAPRIRALGTGHSFSLVADTDGDLVRLDGLPPRVETDPRTRTATVAAGMRYAEVARHLHAAGHALRNLASLPHISVAGACATGTHGSGDTQRSLAAAVTGLELVGPEGDLIRLDRTTDPDRLPGAVVALGALGIVTAVTLEIVPAFRVAQWVHPHLPLDLLADRFDAVFSAAYSVSVFTDWHRDEGTAWLKCRTDTAESGAGAAGAGVGAGAAGTAIDAGAGTAAATCTTTATGVTAGAAGTAAVPAPGSGTGRPTVPAPASPPTGAAPAGRAPAPGRPGPRWPGPGPADRPYHPVPGMPPSYCTEQFGIPGPWHERLPHFRPDFTPSRGAELQSELLLPRAAAPAACAALRRLGGRLAPVLQISEIRTVAADDLWLSPAYGRDSVAFHFTWVPDAPAVLPALAAVEEALLPLGARPHWGKLTTAAPADITARYDRAADFRRLMHALDPAGKFRNPYVDALFPPA